MDGVQLLDGLEFDQQAVLDQEIGDIFSDDDPVILNDDRVLPFDCEARLANFVGRGVLIYLLKKAAAEGIADLEGAANYFSAI